MNERIYEKRVRADEVVRRESHGLRFIRERWGNVSD